MRMKNYPCWSFRVVATLIFLVAGIINVTASTNTPMCGPYRYHRRSFVDYFYIDLTTMMTVLTSKTPAAPTRDYNTLSTNLPPSIFGYAKCYDGIKGEDCKQCLKSASSQILDTCGDTYGGLIKLAGCCLRFEIFRFTNHC
ncbi:hypothetical protein MLD38_035755 [Melastoma candidum]|uniref:Uncharacterized protein n=1 Tax=Melastoma candidum TaxID=119954 RepID=A0ACB9LJE9_9MYRT|nr:hypothetical protein MLD38_035755 [Melastoma candidum]